MFGLKYKLENAKLKLELEEVKKELREANKVIASVNTELTSAEPVIDWSIMNVFSVERMASNNRPATILGYLLPEPVVTTEGAVTTKDVVREWTLYCNEARHQELVDQFKAYKEKGKKK
jgi:hypothetical protein